MAETTTNGERPREDPEKTLWMGDLAFEWDEAFIADLFEGFGAVTAYRPYDPRADRPTLYAFVTFESEAEATRAFEELNGATIPTRGAGSAQPLEQAARAAGGADGAKRPWSRSPGGYDRRSPPGGRWRPGSRTPSRSLSAAGAGARRDDERPSRADRRDRGPGDPGRGDPARDRDEPRRERPANGRPRPDQEEGEAYARLALWRRDGRGLAPRGFLATVDGDDDVRVDADYCARLDASVRQLVDLDVVIERRVAPYAEAAAALAARRSRR
ncbi:hypothetical protein JL722_2673 [Aureococcus anophagefferens]|nr:hypothetical protein JL722_2673 [Aureococcus anophagefferens]